jgi:hypothetical protein
MMMSSREPHHFPSERQHCPRHLEHLAVAIHGALRSQCDVQVSERQNSRAPTRDGATGAKTGLSTTRHIIHLQCGNSCLYNYRGIIACTLISRHLVSRDMGALPIFFELPELLS